jgi:hypothetical protein
LNFSLKFSLKCAWEVFFLKFFLKKILPWMLVLALAAVCPGLMRALPQSADGLAGRRYEGWSGVLRLWTFEGWQPGSGSLSPWLNRCITSFERAHPGVYIQLKPVSAQNLKDFADPALRTPDLILFPPGLIEDASALLPLDSPDLLPSLACTGLHGGETLALPVAMGGYGWARSNALLDFWPDDFTAIEPILSEKSRKNAPAALILPPDGDFLCYSGALIALLGRNNAVPPPMTQRESAPFSAFINGRAAVTPMTQRELRRLMQLEESGRAPDYAFDAESVCFTDQLALLALPDTHFSDSPARQALAAAFAAHLLTPESQQLLHSVRAFPVILLELPLYEGVGGYQEMERALRSDDLRVPPAFVNSWRISAKSLAEQMLSGQISVSSAFLQFKALFPQPAAPRPTEN